MWLSGIMASRWVKIFIYIVFVIVATSYYIIIKNIPFKSALTQLTFVSFGNAGKSNLAKVAIAIDELVEGPLAQDDPRLIKFIRNKFLVPPSNKPYKLKYYHSDPSKGQSDVIKTFFKNRRQLFFVEAGGFDGETRSNTLSLEKDFGWEGILVEGSKKNYAILKQKHRKAWSINACLAVKPYPHKVLFEEKKNKGKILSSTVDKKHNGSMKSEELSPSQCFPLYSILSAINVTEVDYLSLDVEGYELDVLKTIPFESIFIKIMSVEFLHGKGRDRSILKFMKGKNYTEITRVYSSYDWANDLILVHNSLMPTVNPFSSSIKFATKHDSMFLHSNA